jgi:hypothetical protein
MKRLTYIFKNIILHIKENINIMKHIFFILIIFLGFNANCQNDTINNIFLRSIKLCIYEEELDKDISDNYLKCEIQYVKNLYQESLNSNGFIDELKFFAFKFSIEIPIYCYDSTNENKEFIEVTYPRYIVVAYNTKTSKIYRISGFKYCEFLNLVLENNLYYDLKTINSKRKFLNLIFIDKINMELLYELNIGIYKKRNNLKKVKSIINKGLNGFNYYNLTY